MPPPASCAGASTPIRDEPVATKLRNRGVSYWEEGNDRRVFVVAQQYLYAIDATSGKPIASFGDSGRVDLREGLGRDPKLQSISATTPGVVYKDLLILGSIVSEDLPASPGDIRAFDVRTGKIRWTFHTIPHPGEYGYETWPKDAWTYIGGVNDWAGMSLDEKRGWVFAATGSASFDFYGANRLGDDLFANCVIALKADTGRARLAFPRRQTRSVGSRLPRRSDACHREARWATDRCGGANHQVRLCFRLRSGDRPAALPHRIPARCPPRMWTAK